MYNKNGLIMLNRPYAGTSYYVQNTGVITYTDGTTNSSTYLYVSNDSSESQYYAQKVKITGIGTTYSNTYYLTNGNPTIGIRLCPGYRNTPFTETTYTLPDDTSPSYAQVASITTTAGIPTITITNTTAADITVNEICCATRAGNSSSSIDKTVVFAAFSFPDITIAPGEAYTFTIMHKNS